MAEWANALGSRLEWVPAPLQAALLILVVFAASLIIHRYAIRLLRRIIGARYPYLRSILRRARPVTRLAFAAAGLILIVPLLDLPSNATDRVIHALTVLFIIMAGWLLAIAVSVASDRYARRYRIDVEDNLQARRYITQLRVLRRVAVFMIALLTVATALMTFETVREYGISMFASAGVAGLVVGLAARPVLANVIAGVQIALTQPIRLEDVVIVEGEWGWIEEIASTYVVIRIWDWRRMVVPLSYFIEKPFQNWTRETASIIGTVFWHLDYTVPVGAVREKLTDLLDKSPLWDRNVVNLQVTESDDRGVVLRALMSSTTSPRSWDLRCEIREKMIVWLQREYPEALPQTRANLMPADAASPSEPGSTEEAKFR